MPKMSVVQEEVITFLAARMDYPPQTPAEREAFERALHEAVEDMAEVDFRAACKQYRRVGKKWPSPAAIVELSPELARQKLQEAAEPDYWPVLLKAIGSGGIGANEDRQMACFTAALRGAGFPMPPDLTLDRIEASLRAAGGWDAVAGCETEWARSNMAKAFREAMKGTTAAANVVSLDDRRAKNAALPFGNPKRIPTGGK